MDVVDGCIGTYVFVTRNQLQTAGRNSRLWPFAIEPLWRYTRFIYGI